MEESTKDFALTVAIGEVFVKNVSVASFDLPKELAFSLPLCPKNAPCPDIISQKRKEQSIFAIAFEAVELRHKVSAEQGVRLPLGHIRRKTLPLLELMPITHIRITALSVKSLKEFHTHHSTLKRRKPSKSYPLLSPQPKPREAEEKQTEQ